MALRQPLRGRGGGADAWVKRADLFACGAVGGVMRGACLCGAVRVEVRTFTPQLSACHCDMCRRWSGSAMFGFNAPADAVTVEGAVRSRASSDFAERAWCGECGTHLWFRELEADYELSPGPFDDARSFPLVREVYADRAFAACRLAGEHARVTRAEYEADHPFVEETPNEL